MKVYNSKKFYSGLFASLVGVINIITYMQRNSDFIILGIAILCLIFGAIDMYHGLSKKIAEKDEIEENDERAQLVNLKQKTAAFHIFRAICVISGVIMIAIGKYVNSMPIIYCGMGLFFTYPVALLVDFFTFMYYDEKY